MLSKTERKFLENKIEINAGYKNKIRHSIKAKIIQLRKDLELLLNSDNREFINNFKRRYVYEKNPSEMYGNCILESIVSEYPTIVSELNEICEMLNKFNYYSYSGIEEK